MPAKTYLKRALILSDRGQSLLLFIVILAALVIFGSVVTNSMIKSMAKSSADSRNTYEVSYAMESIATYIKDSYDRGDACRNGSGVSCASTATACTVYGANFTTFWDSGVVGNGHLYCFSQLAACGGNGMGVQFTNFTGVVSNVCLALSPGDSSHKDIYAHTDFRNFLGPVQIHFDANTFFSVDLLESSALAVSSGPYAGLGNKNNIPLSNAPALPNGVPGLPAITKPATLDLECATLVNTELCTQQCNANHPCLKIAICVPSATGCLPSGGSNYATLNMRFLDAGMMPGPLPTTTTTTTLATTTTTLSTTTTTTLPPATTTTTSTLATTTTTTLAPTTTTTTTTTTSTLPSGCPPYGTCFPTMAFTCVDVSIDCVTGNGGTSCAYGSPTDISTLPGSCPSYTQTTCTGGCPAGTTTTTTLAPSPVYCNAYAMSLGWGAGVSLFNSGAPTTPPGGGGGPYSCDAAKCVGGSFANGEQLTGGNNNNASVPPCCCGYGQQPTGYACVASGDCSSGLCLPGGTCQ